jgi:hypothetical protein
MPDIIGQILQRLEALEAAVNGRTSEYFDRKLFKAEVALREGVVARTIDRNVAAGRFPPPDGVTNGHAWWWLATLERHDRAVAAKPATTRTPPNAAPPRGRSARDAEMKGLRLRGRIPEARKDRDVKELKARVPRSNGRGRRVTLVSPGEQTACRLRSAGGDDAAGPPECRSFPDDDR